MSGLPLEQGKGHKELYDALLIGYNAQQDT